MPTHRIFRIISKKGFFFVTLAGVIIRGPFYHRTRAEKEKEYLAKEHSNLDATLFDVIYLVQWNPKVHKKARSGGASKHD